MFKKLIYLVSVFLLLSSFVQAEDIQWTDLGADHLWSTPENWSLGRVPTLEDEVLIDVPAASAPNGPIIEDGIDAKVKGIWTEAAGEPMLTMTGGTLEVAEWIWWGDGADSFGIWDMSGGTVTVNEEFELGWGGGAGTLTITGGTISAGEAVIPTGSGAFGELYLYGGTYNVTNADGLGVNENGMIDITEGTLVLEGDDTLKVNDLIAAGKITAYGGDGNLELDFDVRNPGKTTLTATVPPLEPVDPGTGNLVHSWTFDDGTADDVVDDAEGVLIGDAAVIDGQLVLDGDGDWMEMPGDVIAMNTFEELSIEIMFTSVEGGNTGFHMITAFGEEGTGANPGFGYKYICITPARGDDVSRGMIQTVSMDDSPWDEETGVSDVIEHDDGLPHHMVCTVNDMELAFYVDGVLIGTAALDPPGNSIAGIGTDVAYIGKGVYGVDPLWAGSVEELNIYDRALSPDEVQAKYAAGPFKGLVHSYTFEDGTANDSVGSADGTLVGDADVVNGSLVLDGDGDWMEMPGDVIAMNTYPEVTVETWFTSVEGGNTGFHMLAAFGEEATGALDWAGYKYLFITPARGDDVSRAAIQTNSMDDSPWDDETGVSATVEHDDGLEHHFIATVDAANITFYIDGELIGSEPLAAGNEVAGIGQAVAYLGKGVYPADPLWTGSVEELNIYNRALSLDEVQANYAAGPEKEGEVPIDPGTDGLMLHLPLDTASRGSTKDNSGNGLDGTVVGDPAFVEGVDILALALDGVDDYVDCGNPSILDFGTGDFTISAWINMTAIEKGTVYAKGGDNGGGIRYTLAMGETSENTMTLTTDDDSDKVQATGGTVVNDGAWHHVVGMRSGTDLLVYVDGVLDGTNTVPEGYDLSGASQANALIGAITDARDATGATLEKFFAGAIDDVRIYNRALSTLEVLFLAGM